MSAPARLMSRLRGLVVRAVTPFLLAALALSGCSTKQAAPVVRLEITAGGTYVVDGTSVEQPALAAVLMAKRQPGEELLVHVIPQPGSKYEAVHAAVEAVQKAGAKVGMVGNERF